MCFVVYFCGFNITLQKYSGDISHTWHRLLGCFPHPPAFPLWMCLERLILCVKHPWYLRRSRDLVSMPSAPPSKRSQAAVQRAGRGSHTDRSLRVRAVDLQLAVRTTDASPFSLAHLFSVIKVAKKSPGRPGIHLDLTVSARFCSEESWRPGL